MSELPLCRRRFLELTGGLGAGLMGTAPTPSAGSGGTEPQSGEPANPYAHELVVCYHNDELPSAQAAALTVARTLNQQATIGISRDGLGLFKLHLDPEIDTDDRDEIIDRLADRDPIDDVGVETRVTAASRPTDPGYDENWRNGNRRPQGPQNNVDVPAIGLESAWERTKAESTEIAICEDGPVHHDHEDLHAQVAKADNPLANVRWEVRSFCCIPTGGWYVNPPFNPNTPPDEHMTAVAGVAVATHDNDVGIAGACQAGLRSVSTEANRGTDLLGAILYAIEQTPADVVNLSVDILWQTRYIIQLLTDIGAAADHNGTLIVVSAGNVESGNVRTRRPGTIARHNKTVSVSLSNRYGTVDPAVASTGPGITVTAPGWDILTTTYVAGRTDSYGRRFGSSYSAPLVAGIAALGMAYHPGLETDMNTLREHIERTATPIPGMGRERVGAGMINAARLLAAPPGQAGLQATTPTPPPTQQGGGATPSVGDEVSDRATVGAGAGASAGASGAARIANTAVGSTRDDRRGPIVDETSRLVTSEQFETETAIFDAETTPWTPAEIAQDPLPAADSDD